MGIPSVLAKIVATKQEEVAAGQRHISHAELCARAADAPPTRGFKRVLEAAASSGTSSPQRSEWQSAAGARGRT